MKKGMLPAVLVALALCAGACATPEYRVGLPETTRAYVASTDVVAAIPQSEIYIYVPPSDSSAAAGQFGLLGVLVAVAVDTAVDAARTSNSENAAAPLRDSIIDYSFDETLKTELNSALSDVDWLNAGEMRILKETQTPATMSAEIDASEGAAVLVSGVDYHLTNDGRNLAAALSVHLYANTDELRALRPTPNDKRPVSDSGNAIYRNVFTYLAEAPSESKNREELIAAWSQNDGAALRAALNEAAKDLARQLAEDIQAPVASAE